MAKVLKVEKKRIFSNSYVNAVHKKIGGILGITLLVIILVLNMRQFEDPELATDPWYFLGFLMVFFVLDELVRAFMEWKYATNRRDYLYKLSEMLFMVIIIFTFAQTNFLGLIN